MPRRREVPKRTILPDPKFGDQTIAKFINVMMQDGKKSIAERVLYGALDTIGSRGASALWRTPRQSSWDKGSSAVPYHRRRSRRS